MLLFLLVAFSCVGFSNGVEKEKHCYGRKLVLPFHYTPPIYKGPIYFTPRGEGTASRRIIMNNGQSNHPRLKADVRAVTLNDLRETDDGIYSVSFGHNDVTDIIDLKVLDCADEITRTYWHGFSIDVPRDAQYLEFIPLDGREPTVLWNRTGSLVKKDKVQIKWNVIDVFSLTQADNGYYNLRKKDNTLLKRQKLQVEATTVNSDAVENERVFIKYPFTSTSLTVTYIQDGDSEEHTLIDNGITVRQSYDSPWKGRFYKLDDSLEISNVKRSDTGYFYFKDQDGNLAQTVRLEILYGYLPTYVYIIAAVLIILAVVGCCCCVKKCCCRKTSSKRTELEPAVQHQVPDRTHPSMAYSAAPAPTLISYQPARPVAPPGPAPPFSTGPSAAAPSQPTASPADFNAQPNFLSTDVKSTFELKGFNFPSAPLLSSDSTSADVYTSDKLNFL